MSRFIFTLLLSLTVLRLQAEEPILLDPAEDEIFLNSERVYVLEDPDDSFTIDDIRASKEFQKPLLDFPANHNVSSAYWIKFTVKLIPGQKKDWLMECYTFRTNNVEFYLPDSDGNYTKLVAGDQIPFYNRTFSHKNFEFFLPDKPGTHTCYVKFRTADPILFVSVIRSYDRFTAYSLSEYFMLGLYYGIILVIAFYNLFLFLNIREKAYLFYVLYVLAVGFYGMSQDGTGFQYLWPGVPFLNSIAPSFFLLVLVCWLLMYTRSFLNIPKEVPWLDKLFLGYIGLRVIVFFLAISAFPELRSVQRVDLVPFVLCYVGSIILAFRRAPQAKYFVAGFSMLFMSFLINGLMFAKILPSTIFTVYAVNLGVVGEMIFLSLAMADRVREIRESKIRSERESRLLEEMVKERTSELHEANFRLKKQAEEIQAMNKILFADNRKLKENVKLISESKILQEDLTFEEFSRIYPDEESCYRFIAEMKWEKGYSCQKCAGNTFTSGKTSFSKRCTKCGYDESPTAFTLFHAIKIPIRKALYMTFLVMQNNALSAEKLSEILGLTIKTCWSFRKKVLEAASTGNKKSKDWKVAILAQNKKKN